MDCSGPPSKPWERCGQHHWWHERKEFNCSRITGEATVPDDQDHGHDERALREGTADTNRGTPPVHHVPGSAESVEEIKEPLLGAVDAAEQELGSGYMATIWKRLEKKSRDGCMAGIRRYLGVLLRRLDLGVRGALEEALVPVRAGHYEGPIKKVLSGLRIVEKAGRIPTLVQVGDWQWVRAVEKLRIRKIGIHHP